MTCGQREESQSGREFDQSCGLVNDGQCSQKYYAGNVWAGLRQIDRPVYHRPYSDRIDGEFSFPMGCRVLEFVWFYEKLVNPRLSISKSSLFSAEKKYLKCKKSFIRKRIKLIVR